MSKNSKGKYYGKSKSQTSNKSDNRNSSRNNGNNVDYSASKSEVGKKYAKSDAPENQSVNPSSKYDDIRSNDIGWWNKSPMYVDATRVPFNRIYGDPVWQKAGSVLGEVNTSYKAVPGIMVIKYIPTIGCTDGASNAPVNRAFTSLYGDIYSKTTGAMQFQQADLALFMTSFSSIASLIGYVKRALGISQLYNGLNYYYPRALLTALNINPDDVIGHQDALRSRLNDSILSFNNLKIPDFMDIYRRQYALSHNLYADEDNVQAQLYLFKPMTYYKYIDTPEAPHTSYLKSMPIPGTIAGILDAIEDCLMAWRNSSDLGLISGSIQRAFSDNSLIVLDYVVSGDVVLPVVDRNIMWQVCNMNIVPVDGASLDITQNPFSNNIIFAPKMDATTFKPGWQRDEWILNSFDGTIDDEFIMEATRLMTAPLDPSSTSLSIRFANTEIVIGANIWYYSKDIGTGSLGLNSAGIETIYPISRTATTGMIQYRGLVDMLGLLSKFKYAPRVYALAESSTAGNYDQLIFHGDVYRYTTIDVDTLEGLNKAALQSVYTTNVLTK